MSTEYTCIILNIQEGHIYVSVKFSGHQGMHLLVFSRPY